ncbi:protein viaA [Vibrio sp. UCD-FRSSP16_10]|uniref:ATPase RavA stimulator ViaA n=1 Tax=unclassified Vibrio TaxID=2614977 RepID=UPI00080165BE|nr:MULTISPECIES: ATPase RavA stimulator ViaA [unclassified Vibrio]OBT07999.1 protein viaA [Vibrio sp. UCD-FRSSP16_30]OBT17174.1 protein viaA [Vibrio sp. UCD-FRSSP16_10]
MLGVDALNLAMSVADSGMVETAVNDLIGRSQVLIAQEKPGMQASVKNHLRKWKGSVKKRMNKVSESEQIQEELSLYQKVIHWDEVQFERDIRSVVCELKGKSVFYPSAKLLLERQQSSANPMFAHYFCDQWYKSLYNAIKQLQLDELEQDKQKFLDDLYNRMENMKNMSQIGDAGDEAQLGRLWDMAAARLSRTDVSTMTKTANFLRKHGGLKEIANELGRMASQVDDPSLRKTPAAELQMVEEQSDEATDDIVGIHESDDLSKMLPNETLFLAYPELEVIFYKHLVDKRLMNYRTAGKSRKLRRINAHTPSSSEIDLEKGPFIVCVDASGSMSGFPEQCAKAIAFALMQIALAEQRDCFVIMFSTEQITYELTRKDGLREASDFLSYTFHGGTDFEPVLQKCIDLMHTDKFLNADMVVLSDFIAPKQTDDMVQKVEALKARYNRFHAVSLSKYGNPALLDIFSHHWSYHPGLVGRFVKKF